MLDDEQIRERGGTEKDIARYAHDVGGACGAIYGGTCDYCGKTDTVSKFYYTAPENSIFKEVQAAAIEVWERLDSHPSYIAEKVNRIKDLQNVEDNLMYIVAMFDTFNQAKLAALIGEEAKAAIRERLIAGGASKYDITTSIFT